LAAATAASAQVISAPSITVTTSSVASTGTTAIPGGTGSFTNFLPVDPQTGNPLIPTDPMISNGNVVFWGGGTGGQQGIYSSLYGTLVKAADLNTAIPGGSGDFINFFPGTPIIPGDLIAAKLNVLRFGPNVVGSTISDSDRLLTPYGGLLPYGVGTNTTTGKAMLNDSNVLNAYNDDALTPGCTP